MNTHSQRSANTLRLPIRAAGARGIALVVNLALSWITLRLGLVASTEFFRYPAVAVWTIIGMGGATLVYGALTQRSATPDRTFVRIAAVVLVLSFAPDIGLALTVDAVTASEAIGLMMLHVPPAVVSVLALPTTPLGR